MISPPFSLWFWLLCFLGCIKWTIPSIKNRCVSVFCISIHANFAWFAANTNEHRLPFQMIGAYLNKWKSSTCIYDSLTLNATKIKPSKKIEMHFLFSEKRKKTSKRIETQKRNSTNLRCYKFSSKPTVVLESIKFYRSHTKITTETI